MADAPGKKPIFLTETQLDLLGEALMECIPLVAARVARGAITGTPREEVLLLQAYLELAKIIMEPDEAGATFPRGPGRAIRSAWESAGAPGSVTGASPRHEGSSAYGPGLARRDWA